MTIEEELSDSEQVILSRFFDGECGIISSWRAKRLLAKNTLARVFIQNLETIQDAINRGKPLTPKPVDLWDRIEQRIEEEARTELYLGTRRSLEGPTLWGSFASNYATWLGGTAGAAVATIALIIFNSPSPESSSIQQRPSPGRASVVQPISARSKPYQPAFEIPRIRRRIPESFGVDWMRSEDALHLIPDPSGSSAIIWITRDTIPAQKFSPLQKHFTPTPRIDNAQPTRGNQTRATLPTIIDK
jgi:hypothetical protein